MSFKFEIKHQLGFAREGRIVCGKNIFFTPNFILPLNQPILCHFSKRETLGIPLKENFLWGKNQILGKMIDSPLVNRKNQQSLSSDAQRAQENIPVIFEESKELWGYPIKKHKILENEEMQKNNLDDDSIRILTDNFPNKSIKRFEVYNKEASKSRLKFYEEVLFVNTPKHQYILEINFSTETHDLAYIIEWIQRNVKNIIGVRFYDIFKDLKQFNDILKWIFTFKQAVPTDFLWIAAGHILPSAFSYLLYLGFDLIDMSHLLTSGMKGLYLTENSQHPISEIHYPLCNCKSCDILFEKLPIQGLSDLDTKHLIVAHNMDNSLGELMRIKQFMHDQTLRTYLEAKTHANPYFTAILRTLDQKYKNQINARYPLVCSHPVQCIGIESYTRPEIENFMNRIKERIYPSKSYRAIVILPCSAKKPYSQSRSHQWFQKAIRKGAGKQYNQIHQVIITSPLGVIPREMENIFPAAHYDIPVTGDWDEEEITTTGNCLANWLQKYSFTEQNSPQIIVYVKGGYLKACKFAEKQIRNTIPESELKYFEMKYTCNDDFTGSLSDKNQLENLEHMLESALKDNSEVSDPTNKKIKKLHRITDDEIIIKATLDYQFGFGAGSIIIDRGAILIHGKNPLFSEIFVFDGMGKISVGRLYNNSGLIKLAPYGAQLLIEHGKNIVKITEETIQGTSIFRPILDEIDPDLHPGDEILAINKNGQYLGVGELTQYSKDIQKSSRGMVCKLRKKIDPKKFTKINTDIDPLADLGLD